MSASGKTSSSRASRPAAGRPVGSNREATLARVLPAARRLFAEKGFAQTTFKDVGHAVGMSHAALYAYFDSKLSLYVATLADAQALLLPDYLHAIEQGRNLRERISGIVMASAAAHDRDSTITGFLAAVPIEIRRHPELRERLMAGSDAVFVALGQMFEEAKRNGEIRSDASTQNLISAFLGGSVGVALFQYGVQADSLSEAMSVFVAMLEGSIFSV